MIEMIKCECCGIRMRRPTYEAHWERMHSHRPDVPLAHAMLCWEPETSSAGIIRHPDERGVSDMYLMSAGACCRQWQSYSDTERMLNLLVEALHAIGRDDVSSGAVINALMSVPEFRELCADDMLAAFGIKEKTND